MIRKLFIFLWLINNAAMADIIVSSNSVDESYSKNVEVSGEYLVGIQLVTNDDLKSLHVIFPKDSKGNLCIELSTIDGKYKAKIKHQITNPISGVTKVNFKSHYQDILKNYSGLEIAISASLRDSCDSNIISKRLISSWGANVNDELVLLIRSSARKDVAYIPNKQKYVIKSKCKKFRKSYNVSYDKYCVLKGVDLGSLKEIEVVRKNLQPIESEQIKIN